MRPFFSVFFLHVLSPLLYLRSRNKQPPGDAICRPKVPTGSSSSSSSTLSLKWSNNKKKNGKSESFQKGAMSIFRRMMDQTQWPITGTHPLLRIWEGDEPPRLMRPIMGRLPFVFVVDTQRLCSWYSAHHNVPVEHNQHG